MTVKEIEELFEEYIESWDNENIKPDRILHPLQDIHASLLFYKLCPDTTHKMIDWAGHDKISFSPNVEDLAKTATEEDILDLIRLGVFYEDDALCMFV
jgi:hypothetical protein